MNSAADRIRNNGLFLSEKQLLKAVRAEPVVVLPLPPPSYSRHAHAFHAAICAGCGRYFCSAMRRYRHIHRRQKLELILRSKPLFLRH